jgi:hypothetical protein
MPGWYDRAVKELEEQLADGTLSDHDFDEAIRNLNGELQAAADDAADAARDRYYENW